MRCCLHIFAVGGVVRGVVPESVVLPRPTHPMLGRPKVGLGIYIYSCHAGELFGFVPVARDEQAFSC